MDFTQLLLPLQFIVAFVFFVMSVFGNLMVLIVMLNKKTLRQTSANYYIISIAIVDFVSGAFAIPFFAYGVWTINWCEVLRELKVIWSLSLTGRDTRTT